MMHKYSKEKNDRQRDADQPKQNAFSERHSNLHLTNKCADNAAGFHWFHGPYGQSQLAQAIAQGAKAAGPAQRERQRSAARRFSPAIACSAYS
jgi:hypothetical protein